MADVLAGILGTKVGSRAAKMLGLTGDKELDSLLGAVSRISDEKPLKGRKTTPMKRTTARGLGLPDLQRVTSPLPKKGKGKGKGKAKGASKRRTSEQAHAVTVRSVSEHVPAKLGKPMTKVRAGLKAIEKRYLTAMHRDKVAFLATAREQPKKSKPSKPKKSKASKPKKSAAKKSGGKKGGVSKGKVKSTKGKSKKGGGKKGSRR